MKTILLILVFSISGLLVAQHSDYSKSIDNLMRSLAENKAFSGSVLLQKEGKTSYKGEFNTVEPLQINIEWVLLLRFLRRLLFFS